MDDEHLGEIILNLDQHMSIFFLFFKSGGHFVWRSGPFKQFWYQKTIITIIDQPGLY